MTSIDPERKKAAPLPLEGAEAFSLYLKDAGFRETDMQFNIGRVEGGVTNGFDMVNPKTKERLYVTSPGSPESEEAVWELLGKPGIFGAHVLLDLRERTEDYAVYDVPRGSRLLTKLLETSPYHPAYMNKLNGLSSRMLAVLAAADEHSFGVDINTIAFTHNGSTHEGDNYLTIIPPLAERFVKPAATDVPGLLGTVSVSSKPGKAKA
ncbi:MAG: hypothetical protein WBP26_05515 [Candidatus Saccharimonadales bacterium]